MHVYTYKAYVNKIRSADLNKNSTCDISGPIIEKLYKLYLAVTMGESFIPYTRSNTKPVYWSLEVCAITASSLSKPTMLLQTYMDSQPRGSTESLYCLCDST